MVELVHEHKSFLGEGPIWDPKRHSVCWVDIVNGEIHEWFPDSRSFKTMKVHQMIGAVAICENGHLLAALKNGIAIVDRETGEIEHIIHPEAHIQDNRYNDGKCDPAGRFWIGSMSVDELPDLGTVYMLDEDLALARKIENTTISNGMAWSPDQRHFYYIDSPTSTVVSYNYDVHTGEIYDRTVVVHIDEKEGFPDGMTIDEEGMLWVAHWGGWQVSRWNPFTGEKLFKLPLPVENVSSCVFGGERLEDLYITSARKGLTEKQLAEQTMAGSLFVWKNCGFKGLPAFDYKNYKAK